MWRFPSQNGSKNKYDRFEGAVAVYRPDIQQGNLITQEMVSQLKPGMTKAQVLFIMGTPVLQNTFDDNRWVYLYVFDSRNQQIKEEKQMSIYFKNDRIDHISKLSYPHPPGKKQLPIPMVDELHR